MSETLIEKLYESEPEERIKIIVLPESSSRDVLKQLAQLPRWDGDLNSKHGRDILMSLGYAARWNGLNFLTPTGYAVADALYSLHSLVHERPSQKASN